MPAAMRVHAVIKEGAHGGTLGSPVLNRAFLLAGVA
jgi:hypothetical protein